MASKGPLGRELEDVQIPIDGVAEVGDRDEVNEPMQHYCLILIMAVWRTLGLHKPAAEKIDNDVTLF